MKNESNQNSKKAKKKKSKKLSAKSVVLVIFLAVLVIGVFVAVSGEIPFDELFSLAPSSSDGSSPATNGSGFPVSVSSPITNVGVSKGCVYALTNNSVICLDKSGKKKEEIILNYSDPMIRTNGRFALIYDRQGTRYTLFNGEKNLLASSAEDSALIYTASVEKNGDFLIVTSSNKAASSLSLYNKKGDVQYKWNCANEYIVSADISDNSKNLVCAAVGSTSGQIMTRVYFFDLDNSNNNRDYSFNDTSALECFFSKGKNVCVTCNNRRIAIDFSNDSLSPIQAQFSGTLYKLASDDDGNTAVLLRKNDSYNEFELKVFADDNNITLEKEINDTVKDIACDKSKFFVMTDSSIMRVSNENKEIASFSSSFESLTAKNGRIYYYSTGVICKG